MKNKKAGFALTAIVLCAAVGGAFAFKAQRTKSIWYAPVAGNPCNVPYPSYTTVAAGQPGFQTHASVQQTTAACDLTTVTRDI